jgi:hypothetical protein
MTSKRAPYSIMISAPSARTLNPISRGRNSFPVLNSSGATPQIVREDPETKNVFLRYATADEGSKRNSIWWSLSVGLNPPAENQELAEKFGIALNSHGFCEKRNPSNPMETTRPGIFVSGAFQGPTDIPESVFTASAAGAQCGAIPGLSAGQAGRRKSTRRSGMSPRRRRKSASLCAIAGPTSAAWSMFPLPLNMR